MLRFRSRDAAAYCLRRLKKNKPCIVRAEVAERMLREQALAIAIDMAGVEEGWDGHKGHG